jgi:hypothetical protein
VVTSKYNTDPLGNYIKVYPNPVESSGTLEINTKEPNTKLQVMMTNMQGQVVYKNEFISPVTNIKNIINMTNLPRGMYTLIVFFNERDNRILKVIKM